MNDSPATRDELGELGTQIAREVGQAIGRGLEIMAEALKLPVLPECHCQDCDPEMHESCSADCMIFDCSSSDACCNDDCAKR